MNELRLLNLSDEELLSRWIADRDREAADEIIRRHESALYSFTWRLCGSSGEASDVVQESFLRMLRNAAQYKGGNLRSWIFGIALNVARSQRFKLGRLRKLFRPLVEEEVLMVRKDSDLEKKLQTLAEIDKAVADLPRSSREPILLHYYEGFSYEEMGRMLGCSPGTVASRLNTARRRLEQKLRRSGMDMAALGAVGLLSRESAPELPLSLRESLRGLPEKALTQAAGVSGASVIAKLAVGIATTLLGGGVYYALHEGVFASHSPNVAVNKIVIDSPKIKNPDLYMTADNPCEEALVIDRPRREMLAVTPFRKENSTTAKLATNYSLQISGFVRESDSDRLLGCQALRLSAVWPHVDLMKDQAWVETNSDTFGHYQFSLEKLPSGIYELSAEAPFAVPLWIDLRKDSWINHDFALSQASHEEKNEALQPYRASLQQALKERWQEEGASMMEIHLAAGEPEEMEAAVFSLDRKSVENLVQVFEPIRNELLLGPLNAGRYRVECVAVKTGYAIFSEIGLSEKTTLPLETAIRQGSDYLSCEIASPDGKPIVGAKVELVPHELWSGIPLAVGRTDVHGRACFEGLPGQPVHLDARVTAPTSEFSSAARCEVETNGLPLKIQLE